MNFYGVAVAVLSFKCTYLGLQLSPNALSILHISQPTARPPIVHLHSRVPTCISVPRNLAPFWGKPFQSMEVEAIVVVVVVVESIVAHF